MEPFQLVYEERSNKLKFNTEKGWKLKSPVHLLPVSPPGPTGLTGTKGYKGLQGPQGPDGSNGKPGSAGPQGLTVCLSHKQVCVILYICCLLLYMNSFNLTISKCMCLSGPSGDPGRDGETGAPGPCGLPGNAGDMGRPGTVNTNGLYQSHLKRDTLEHLYFLSRL